jgi:secreted trypsin-like serine protease
MLVVIHFAGDSGGPLYDSVGEKLVGVISSGADVCYGYPLVTTRLASHVSLLSRKQVLLSIHHKD